MGSTEGFYRAQLSLNAWFTCELLLRVLAEGRSFCCSADRHLNVFDVFLVGMSILDLVFSVLLPAGVAMTGRVVRLVRLMRIIRTLRLARVMSYIRDFRKMVYSLQASMQTLVWSLLLLWFVIYGFAIVFVQGTLDYLKAYDEPDQKPELRDTFGSLMRGCYSLYIAIADGKSWDLLLDPLTEVDPLFTALFLIFISLCMFGVLNVMSAIFVESAMASAQYYKDLLIQDRLRAKEITVGHMKDVFYAIDLDQSGEISIDEFSVFLQDPQLRMYLESLEITAEDTAMLFALMDVDDSGCVDITEFCSGLLRLQGDAKSFDIHTMIFNNMKFLRSFERFAEEVHLEFDMLEHYLDELPRHMKRGAGMRRGLSNRHLQDTGPRMGKEIAPNIPTGDAINEGAPTNDDVLFAEC